MKNQLNIIKKMKHRCRNDATTKSKSMQICEKSMTTRYVNVKVKNEICECQSVKVIVNKNVNANVNLNMNVNVIDNVPQ